VEIIVSVVLLSILSIATITLFTATQRTTAQNRARIAAANLAQRELEFAEEQITASDSGGADLVAAASLTDGHLINPHPLNGSDPGEPYTVDGMAYTVEVVPRPHLVDGGSACAPDGPDDAQGADKLFATLVTVNVTWTSMGTALPETVSQLFAPHLGVVSSETEANTSVIVVSVAGSAAAGSVARPNVAIVVENAQGEGTYVGTTNGSGCAPFSIPIPEGTTGTFRVRLEGSTVPTTTYVSSDRQTQPTRNNIVVDGPHRLVRVEFENYDIAGKLTVVVAGSHPLVDSVRVAALNGLTAPFLVPLVNGEAEMTDLYPGTYTVSVATGDSATVTLGEGQISSVTLAVPALPPPTEGPGGGDDDCGREPGVDYGPDNPITPDGEDPCDEDGPGPGGDDGDDGEPEEPEEPEEGSGEEGSLP
jgi:type II secretory pathway pseudopilin PulG